MQPPKAIPNKSPRWMLLAWLHLVGVNLADVSRQCCEQCQTQEALVQWDDYCPLPAPFESLLALPIERATDVVFDALRKEQTQDGPRIHRSYPLCPYCTEKHVRTLMPGQEQAGIQALLVLGRSVGKVGVAIVNDTKDDANGMAISYETTPEGLFRLLEAREQSKG